MAGLLLNTIYERPIQSLLGVGLVALGVPVFVLRRTLTTPPRIRVQSRMICSRSCAVELLMRPDLGSNGLE